MDTRSLRELLEPYVGKRILIVGGTGYLGSRLVEQLKTIPCEIEVLGRNIREIITTKCPGKVLFHKRDISDPNTWEEIPLEVDYIFYLAAQTSVAVADAHPLQDYKINVLPFVRLLSRLGEAGVGTKIVFAGTVTEFGIPRYLPVDEYHPDNPITVYDLHKLNAEKHLESYCRKGVVNGCTLRLSNVYGPGGSSSSTDRGVLHVMMNRALRGKKLTLYGDGENIRDYIFTDDVIRAFLCVAPLAEQLNSRKFVISSGVGTTIREAFEIIIDLVLRLYGTSVEVEILDKLNGPQTEIDRRDFIGNPTAFSEETDWWPLMGFRQGVENTIKYFASISNKH